MDIRTLFTISFLFITQLAHAEPSAEQLRFDLDHAIDKLDKINYLPNLLPIIIKNKEFIGLSQKQVDDFDEWRKTNSAPMLAKMQKITSKRIEIKQAALSSTVSSSRLIQMQNEIFRLQREVIEYKLSCREHIIRTFNNRNWINFYMLLADENVGIAVPLNYADAKRLQHVEKSE
jgi:hypothetical protein